MYLYIQREIQLSGFSAYPVGLSSQLIRMSGVSTVLYKFVGEFKLTVKKYGK